MALKQCEQCTEMVDEAKAFCPGCGYAFVSERPRGELTDYEAKGQTVQLGQTMYNQMLSDMGLNGSKAAIAIESIPEVSEPASPTDARSPELAAKPNHQPVIDKQKKGVNKWLIVGIVALVLVFFAVVIVIAAAAVFFYLRPI